MELTEHEILLLKWLYNKQPKRFSINNKSQLPKEFVDEFLWGPLTASSKNIYNIILDLESKKLIEIDPDGYFLSDKGKSNISAIINDDILKRQDEVDTRQLRKAELEMKINEIFNHKKVESRANWAIVISVSLLILELIKLLMAH